jgi:adenylate kinase
MRVIFLGPPGAGKGTQAKILQSQLGAKQISTGDILRENRMSGTDLGKLAEGYMRSGALVPDEVIIKMIEAELAKAPEGFIMDGFPRTVCQAEAFDSLLQSKDQPLNYVVLFQADRDTLFKRLTARWTNPRTGRTYNSLTNPPRVPDIDDQDGGPLVQREDDKPETVNKRLDVYERQTVPLVEYYGRSGKLVTVDALAPVDSVTREIVAKVVKDHAA